MKAGWMNSTSISSNPPPPLHPKTNNPLPKEQQTQAPIIDKQSFPSTCFVLALFLQKLLTCMEEQSVCSRSNYSSLLMVWAEPARNSLF